MYMYVTIMEFILIISLQITCDILHRYLQSQHMYMYVTIMEFVLIIALQITCDVLHTDICKGSTCTCM